MSSIGAGDGVESAGSAPVERVPVGGIRPRSDSPRDGSCNEAHVHALAASGREFEPLLVHRPTMRVIDGMHRLFAARLRGHETIAVRFFDGSEDDAYVLSVQLNIRHGLPLSRAERRAAAERILRSHPHWSDRSIAERTGLSGKTVGLLRKSVSAEIPHSHTRVGKDGSVRPIDSTDGRLRAAALLTAEPTASLRELARRSGVSTATVRDVRDRLSRGEDPVPPGRRGAPRPAYAPQSRHVDPGEALRKLARDPSLRGSEPGRLLLRALIATEFTPQQWQRITDALPEHCVPLVRAVAAHRSARFDALMRATHSRARDIA